MRSAVIEIGGTTTRAVVADPAPGGGLAIRLDRRIVLRLRQAVERQGAVGDGLRLLVVETVRRLQAECFRAGVSRPHVVVAADLSGAEDLAELLVSLRRCQVVPVEVRSPLGEARLLLHELALDGDLAVADVGDRSVRVVDRIGETVVARRLPGPLTPRHTTSGHHPRGDRTALDDVGPLDGRRPVVTGPVAANVVRALWAQNGRGPRAPARCEVAGEAFAALERELLALSPTQRLLLPAVAPDEVDTVVLGAGYLHALTERWEVARLLFVSTSSVEAQLRRLLATSPVPDGAATGVRA